MHTTRESVSIMSKLFSISEDGKWVVFEGEHGQRYNIHSFENEREACLYFWKRIQVFL